MTASKTAELACLTRRSMTVLFVKIRQRIAEEAERASPFAGEVEVDESYFGARRVRGKRGRGASGKTIVFSIFKRNGSVYTEIVPIVESARYRLLFVTESRLTPSSTVMAGVVMMGRLMSDTVSISGFFIRRMNLLMQRAISMG